MYLIGGQPLFFLTFLWRLACSQEVRKSVGHICLFTAISIIVPLLSVWPFWSSTGHQLRYITLFQDIDEFLIHLQHEIQQCILISLLNSCCLQSAALPHEFAWVAAALLESIMHLSYHISSIFQDYFESQIPSPVYEQSLSKWCNLWFE